jgi:hypothetical protein
MFVPVPLCLAGWMHSGYPIMAYMSEGDRLNLPKWIGRDNGWGWFHELGKSDRGLFRAAWKVGTTRIGGGCAGQCRLVEREPGRCDLTDRCRRSL